MGCFSPCHTSSWMEREPRLLKVGTCCRLALRRPEVHTAAPSPARLPEGRHSLARLVQKAPRRALAAHEDVLLQRLLMEHPVAHAEGGVTCRKAKGQCGPACLKPSTVPTTSSHCITQWEQSRFPSILLGLLLKFQSRDTWYLHPSPITRSLPWTLTRIQEQQHRVAFALLQVTHYLGRPSSATSVADTAELGARLSRLTYYCS